MRSSPLCLVVYLALCGCHYEAPEGGSSPSAHADTITTLRSFVEQDPDDFVSMYTLARFAERRGNPSDALHWLGRIEATSWNRWVEDADFGTTSADPSYAALRDRLNAKGLRVLSAESAFEIDQLELLPEGMAWDPTTDRFLISSGRQRKVVSVGRDGVSFDLVRPAQDGVFATLGMKVDDRRRELWVASAAAPFMIDSREEDAGGSALYSFDADTGETLGYWDAPWSPALLNDLVVAPDGSVFVTESMSGAVLRRVPDADELDAFLPRNTFFGPNGIAISENGATLYIAHYEGISRVDVETREVTNLESSDRGLRLGGIDGLYVAGWRLIGIQNLIGKGRIWSVCFEGDRIARAEVLESGNSSFMNPTTGAIAGEAFFFMSNPKLQDWDGAGVSPAPEGRKLEVLWIPLEWSEAH